jgi:hypothetical protein
MILLKMTVILPKKIETCFCLSCWQRRGACYDWRWWCGKMTWGRKSEWKNKKKGLLGLTKKQKKKKKHIKNIGGINMRTNEPLSSTDTYALSTSAFQTKTTLSAPPVAKKSPGCTRGRVRNWCWFV